MDRTVAVLDREEQDDRLRAYWRGRTPAECLAELERLRREYISVFLKDNPDGLSQGLRRTLRLVERGGR